MDQEKVIVIDFGGQVSTISLLRAVSASATCTVRFTHTK